VTGPVVSVAIANYNGREFLEDALRSALAQDLQDLEVIVVDDGSTDGGWTIAEQMAEADPRVRLERLGDRRGPGAARNRAIELARGEWLAVLDHDDFMHPARLARLIERARLDEAQIIADDQLVFSSTGEFKPARLLQGRRAKAPTWLTAERFLWETRLFRDRSNLGFLKPVVHLGALRASGVRYDPDFIIGEDHDFLLRLLTIGLRCRVDPFLGYFYRKHACSLSHRLTSPAIAAMGIKCAQYRASLGEAPGELKRAADGWRSSIATGCAFVDAVDAIKAGRLAAAAALLARRPQALPLFRMPLAAKIGLAWAHVAPRRRPSQGGESDAWFITRQRICGRTNGSSNYLLDIAQTVRRAGRTPRLLKPSPIVLGRWPMLWLRREMGVFASIRMRGVVRLGPLVMARDPSVYLAAARAIASKALAMVGLPSAWLGARAAPFAPAAPLSAADRLYVGRQIGPNVGMIVADYAWQTEALAYALNPKARTAVVMHDLFHQRAIKFPEFVSDDLASDTSGEDECRLLARAEAIIAIQKSEAAEVAVRAPGRRVLLAPMTATPASRPQSGDARYALFVASNSNPNYAGLIWMLDHVWPQVRAEAPDVQLWVAGGIRRRQPPRRPGVRYLGFVERLDRLYARAGVVVSPLVAGSGLKIKLVEAMAHGKACVVTPVTLQGIEEEAAGAVAMAETPDGFAEAILRLLADEPARLRLGQAALDVVRTHFSAERLHADLTNWLTEPDSFRTRQTAPRRARRPWAARPGFDNSGSVENPVPVGD
jgi:succinoglycan biosynthesis protein ExoO